MALLKQVKMVNCQCWKSPKVISFTSGLNVIRSDNNNVGKSVLFKGLRIALVPQEFDKDDRLEFITFGQKYAEMTYLFDTNEVVIVRIFPNKVVYYYSETLSNPKFVHTVDSPPDEFTKALSVIIEPETGYIMNVIDSDRPLFLINSENDTNKNVLEFLTEHEQLKRLKEDYALNLTELTNALGKVYEKELDYRSRLERLNVIDVQAFEERINQAEKLSEVFDAMAKVYNLLCKIPKCGNNVGFYEEQINTCDLILGLSNTGILDATLSKCNITDTETTLANTIVDICNTGILSTSTRELKDIKKSDLEFVKFGEQLQRFIADTTFDEKPFKYYKKSLELIDVMQAVMRGYNGILAIQKSKRLYGTQILKVNETQEALDLAESVLPLEVALDTLDNSLCNYKKLESTIKLMENALDTLARENEVLDCPVHGKIVNKDGVCIPVLKTSSNIDIVEECEK